MLALTHLSFKHHLVALQIRSLSQGFILYPQFTSFLIQLGTAHLHKRERQAAAREEKIRGLACDPVEPSGAPETLDFVSKLPGSPQRLPRKQLQTDFGRSTGSVFCK